MVEDKVVELPNLGLGEVGSTPTYHIIKFKIFKVSWQRG